MISSSEGCSKLTFCALFDLKEKQIFELSSTPVIQAKVIDTSAEEEEQLSLLILLIDAEKRMNFIDLTFDRDTDKWTEPVQTTAFF